MQGIRVYGADWCHATFHTLLHLQDLGLDFDYINIDHDPHARHWVRSHNHGQQKLPTLDIAGRILSIPTDHELDRTLQEQGLLH